MPDTDRNPPDCPGLPARFHIAIGDHLGVIQAECPGQVLKQLTERGQFLLGVLRDRHPGEVAGHLPGQGDVMQAPVPLVLAAHLRGRGLDPQVRGPSRSAAPA